MANEKVTNILEEIKTLSILELADLVKAVEEEFGVSAAPVAVAGAAVAAAPVEEKTEFDVVLVEAGASKLNVIKVVRELTGHGIGTTMHQDPDVPNYGRPGHGYKLKKGMAICIEPMITLGTREIELLDDQWTIVTQDGKPASHYENTILITDEGPYLTTYDYEEGY